jgi:hypothetical protein
MSRIQRGTEEDGESKESSEGIRICKREINKSRYVLTIAVLKESEDINGITMMKTRASPFMER